MVSRNDSRPMSQRDLSRLFAALSKQIRREILEILRAEGEQHVGELVSRFNLAQPTVSRNLKILQNADLVVDERRGKMVFYSLRRDTLASLVAGYFRRF